LARALDLARSSALERRVEALLRGSGLPPHVREHPVGRWRLDFAWPDRRVAVEADGRRWHSSAADFERDRSKSNALNESGWKVLRVTWSDLDDPGPLGATLKGLLDP
jgi:very-short-patch-repair endonuclease